MFNEQGGERKKNSWLTWGAGIVLALVIVSFVGLPLMQSQSSGPSIVFGNYKGRNITYNDSPSIFSNQVNRRAGNLGSNVPVSQIRDAWRKAFDDTAFSYMVEDLMRQAGYAYSQSQVDQSLIEQVFTDENDNADIESLSRVPGQQLQYLEQAVRSQLFSDQWRELQNRAILDQGSRLATLLTTPPLPLRKFTVAFYRLSDFPLEEVEKFFRDNQQDFDQLVLSRITVSKNDLPALQEKIDAEDSDFAQLAEQYSTDFYRELGGKIGKKTVLELKDLLETDELVQQLSQAASGDIVNYQREDGTVTLFRVDEAKTASQWEDEEVQRQVRSHLENNELSLITDYLRAKAELLKLEVDSGDESLLQRAEAGEVEAFDTDYLALNYGGLYPLFKSINQAMRDQANLASSAGRSELFFQRAFGLAKDQVSQPILLDGRTVILLQLLDERDYLPADGPFGALPSQDIVIRYAATLTKSLAQEAERQALLKDKSLHNNFDQAFDTIYGRAS